MCKMASRSRRILRLAAEKLQSESSSSNANDNRKIDHSVNDITDNVDEDHIKSSYKTKSGTQMCTKHVEMISISSGMTSKYTSGATSEYVLSNTILPEKLSLREVAFIIEDCNYSCGLFISQLHYMHVTQTILQQKTDLTILQIAIAENEPTPCANTTLKGYPIFVSEIENGTPLQKLLLIAAAKNDYIIKDYHIEIPYYKSTAKGNTR
ncbi:hypothetical protein FQA39_LY13300 [Lamprigera yunnana]|nr:hypothetical protein FQA39_LY13300 [Lamprigera yunnana]